MTDHELRALMSSNMDEGAQALYCQYAQYMYAIIFRILRDCGTKEDVEDCFAEVFVEIVQHQNAIQGESLKAYIGQASRNRALNYARSLQKHKSVPLESIPEPEIEHVQEDLETQERNRVLLEKIQDLGEPDSTIIVQKYYFDRPMREIAKMVGLTTHAAQVRCGRALKKLRSQLEDWR